ncbi:Queuosine salvage protein [Mycena indigotica]|uniref:Queuosine 5'-phosphate N-glycosylase/hydrolase n=1 Tax=Mycena indigotica TaxID=2126181 RepID=A0A8H6SQ35_9AGAR|nr:Queuosine salvage protein [Mycena indigotica]KAF7301915.1 Queuosine salvage protein [Mycena indigotica]
MTHTATPPPPADVYDEKTTVIVVDVPGTANPVVESSEFAYRRTNIVGINDSGVRLAAKHILDKMRRETYTPRTWRTHPLHLCPVEPYSPTAPSTKACLDWIFLISALNFSFWSEKEDGSRYGVRWYESWEGSEKTRIWTGYWSLVAALDRALQESIPITDPQFYASETLCPDSLIEHVFRPAEGCTENVPLLAQRIAIMREVGFILCRAFGGSYQGLLDGFQREHDGKGTALQLVQKVVDTFPSFRDEVFFEGRRVCVWKRAQILVAETWAAFFPAPPITSHPLFPKEPAIHQLTMFADYRVPQILHHLRILTYPPSLIAKLHAGTLLAPGSAEELSLRAASVVAVEQVRKEMQLLANDDTQVSSVLIDFYLWDLAKRVERGEERIEGIETAEMVPTHRTRSIWY